MLLAVKVETDADTWHVMLPRWRSATLATELLPSPFDKVPKLQVSVKPSAVSTATGTKEPSMIPGALVRGVAFGAPAERTAKPAAVPPSTTLDTPLLGPQKRKKHPQKITIVLRCLKLGNGENCKARNSDVPGIWFAWSYFAKNFLPAGLLCQTER